VSVTPRRHSGANDLTSEKGLPKKWDRPKAAKSSKKIGGSTPDTKGKHLTLKHLYDFLHPEKLRTASFPREYP